MNMLNTYNLFVVRNNNHTRYDSFRDKMDTIDYVIISPNVIADISNISSEETEVKKLRSEDKNISLKLYHIADWPRINKNIKNKLSKIFGLYDIIKRRPITEIKLSLKKIIEIIHQEIENNIPEIKIKERNISLPEYFGKK